MEDPQITGVEPVPLATFLSGGRVLTLTGSNFHVIQQPGIFINAPQYSSVRVVIIIVNIWYGDHRAKV